MHSQPAHTRDPYVRCSVSVALMALAVSALATCGRGESKAGEASQSPESTQSAPVREIALKTLKIPVEGMACVACAANVKKTLTAIDGVTEVEVNLGERNARVSFDPNRVAPERLVAAINALGYSAGIPVSVPR